MTQLSEAEACDARFGLVADRDHAPQDTTFVTRVFDFTADAATFQQHVDWMSAQGGGDGPEAVAASLAACVAMPWRPAATKVVVHIADAPPHGLGERGDGFPDGAPDGVDPLVVLDQMSMTGITIYSVGCQPALSQYRYATEFFIAAAQRTNGQAVSLASAGALADVILGASVEEMDLEALTQQVQRMAEEWRSAEPTLADAELERRVYDELQSRGTRTRQMGGDRLKSVNSHLVSA